MASKKRLSLVTRLCEDHSSEKSCRNKELKFVAAGSLQHTKAGGNKEGKCAQMLEPDRPQENECQVILLVHSTPMQSNATVREAQAYKWSCGCFGLKWAACYATRKVPPFRLGATLEHLSNIG